MTSSFAASAVQAPVDDILALLPVSILGKYVKGEIIYSPTEPATNLYLVTAGKVKLSQIAVDGSEILLEIIRPEELFGESAFVNGPCREQATALGNATLMIWPVSRVEDLVTRRPLLALSLLRIFAQRTADFARRIESFSIDTVERRLARSLIHFSERLGAPEGNGSFRMMPLTHELLSSFIGAQRETVTHYMNQFRKRGCLSYSRQGMVLDREALAASITREALPATARGLASSLSQPQT